MYVIGLTGGIGSGKSTTAQIFVGLGIEIISADQFAQDLVQADSYYLKEIIKHFGQCLLIPIGSSGQKQLDRKQLRELIFADPAEKQWLEALLHPAIREKMRAAVEAAQSPYCILEIPLLLETEPNPIIDRILVVDAPEALRIQRAQQHHQLSPEQIKQTIQQQISRSERLQAADDVIVNDSSLAALEQKIRTLHEKYLQLGTDTK